MTEKAFFKAAGKVLIAGGYGVLEQENLGLSLAINKHYYSIGSLIQFEQDSNQIEICVKSPQIYSEWNYFYNIQAKTIRQQQSIENVFTENAIKYALSFVSQSHNKNKKIKLSIIILFDRGFLSEQQLSGEKSKFIYYSQPTTKTGLGSSACVIVVIVGVILKLLLGQIDLNVINCISQVANLAAQNKIGSNFDISTAVYGSHLYQNLLPRTAFDIIKNQQFHKILKMDPQIKRLECINKQIKNGYCCMIDLRKGSNTRKMVNSFTKQLDLLSSNAKLAFFRESKKIVERFHEYLSSQEYQIDNIKRLNKQYRSFLQNYSQMTNVPIQPPEFKDFMDKICQLVQIVYAICPGSGGYDAIFIMSNATHPNEIELLHQMLLQICTEQMLNFSISEVKIIYDNDELSIEQQTQINTFLNTSSLA